MLFTKHKYFYKKRTVVLTSIIFVTVLFLLAGPVMAQVDFGLADANPGLGTTDLKTIIVNIIKVALGFLGLLAVIFILYGGFVWMTAGGNQDKIVKARKILINAAIGLLIILSSYALASYIFKQIGWVTGADFSTSRDGAYYYSGGLAGGIIQSHYPSSGEVDVPRNISIAVTFREQIDRDTIIDGTGQLITDNFSISDADGNEVEVASVSTVDNYSFVVDPVVPEYLGDDVEDTIYVVTLGSGITKASGDPAFGSLGSYDWQFTTSTDIDLTPPQVTSISPKADTANPRNAVVQINFNEAINPLSVAGDTSEGFDNLIAKIINTEILVSGTYSIANQYKTVEFITNDLCGTNSCGGDVYCLPGAEDLDVTVKAASLGAVIFDGAVDMANNSLDGDADGIPEGPELDSYDWQFATTDEVDLVPPKVVAVTPGVSANEISTRSKVKVVFDKLMMLSSLDTDSLMIDRGVEYWINSSNRETYTESFINHEELAEYTTYNPLVTNKCRDLYQNCFNPASGPGDFKIGGTDESLGWENGTELGSINHTQVPGQLRLNFKGIETPYLWVARSNLNQIVRVDTATGAIAGPYTVGSNPSRTSVDSYGRVWVANRNSCNINVILTTADGTVVYNRQFSTSPACGPRGVAVDANNDVWVAGDRYVIKLSGQDNNLGQRIAGPISVNAARYGAVIDRNGYLWVDNYWDGNIAVIDTVNNVLIRDYQIKPRTSGYMYGITADPEGNVWLAGAHQDRNINGSVCDVVVKLNTDRIIAGETTNTYTEYCTNGSYVRGVAVDKYGYIWATNYYSNKVTKMLPTGEIVGLYTTGSGPLGISADAGGNIWVVNYSGGGPAQQYTSCSGGTTTKYSAQTGEVIGTYCVGGLPYTYSDMTGFGYQSVVSGLVSGEWTSNAVDLEGLSRVSSLYVHGDFPTGTSVDIQVRGSSSASGLNSTQWQLVADDGSVELEAISWLQLRLTLKSVRANISPSINSISINKISLTP